MHGGGRGLAGQLQRHVIDYARRAGYQELYLYSACRDFYERFGWRYNAGAPSFGGGPAGRR
jgi:predicted N-acetyltransferase YhbS